MSEKSVTVTMPVLMKDEKKYRVCGCRGSVGAMDTRYILLLDCVIQALILIHPYHLPSHLLPGQTNQPPTYRLNHLMMTTWHMFHVSETSLPEFAFLEPNTYYNLVATQQNNVWITYIYFVC